MPGPVSASADNCSLVSLLHTMLLSTTGLSALALLMGMAQAKVVTYNWNITYVMANPDGLYERQVIGINGQFP